MNKLTRREVVILAGAPILVGLAFALALRAQPSRLQSDLAPAAAPGEKPSFTNNEHDDKREEAFSRVLIQNIGTVPFEDLFELLRTAPPPLRMRWIQQLSEMPHGPQRNAAIGSFYKTYVQLDARGAADSIKLIHDQDTLVFVVNAVIDAAPISAMPILAER